MTEIDTNLYVRTYSEPPVNKKEIFRYAGDPKGSRELEELVDECVCEIKDKLCYKVCYREFAIRTEREDGYLDLGFAKTGSLSLAKNLCGCQSIVLFAATVGIGCDRLIARYASVSPTKSLIFQAIGAERIESLCDMFNKEMATEKGKAGCFLRPRFSAGYGDLPIELQKDIFSALDCQRRIGLTLNESMLMSPSKSVSAIIGVGKINKD